MGHDGDDDFDDKESQSISPASTRRSHQSERARPLREGSGASELSYVSYKARAT